MQQPMERLLSFLVFGSTLFALPPKPEPPPPESTSQKQQDEGKDLDSEYGPLVELGSTEEGPGTCVDCGEDQGVEPDCGDGCSDGDGDGDGS
jgi:hypothetical protein